MAIRVNPTRMELSRLKKRLKTATRGHKLLKDKRDEMVRQFMGYIRRDKELREQVERQLGAAMGRFAIACAQMGSEAVSEALLVPAREAKVQTGRRNIMSVDVPTIQYVGSDEAADLPYGFRLYFQRAGRRGFRPGRPAAPAHRAGRGGEDLQHAGRRDRKDPPQGQRSGARYDPGRYRPPSVSSP